MRELTNAIYQHGERLQGRIAKPLAAIVRSYDAAHYAVKVELQPEGKLTGWVPLDTPFIGMSAPPEIGEIVDIEFEQGDIETGRVKGVRYGGVSPAQNCPAGERWFVHMRTGTLLKMHNDGSLELYSAAGTSLTAGGNIDIVTSGNATVTASGNVVVKANQLNVQAQVNVQGNVAVTGNITATGTITDNVNTTPHTL